MKKKTKKRLWLIVVVAAVVIAAAYFLIPRGKAAGVKVYFFKGDKLFAVERPLKADETPLNTAFRELVAGPSAEELGQGVASRLPADVKIFSLRVQGKTAIINFNRQLGSHPGGAAQLQGMLKQIVYTATEIPGIEKAWVWLEGKTQIVLGGEGLVLDRPLSRRDLSD